MKKIFLFLIGLSIIACSHKITTDGGEANIGNVMINAINKKVSSHALSGPEDLSGLFSYIES